MVISKDHLQLTAMQRSFMIGSLLGDGTMRIGKGAINANFKVEHGLRQKDYVMWKYSLLKNFVSTEPKESYRYDESGERYKKSWWFRTVRHPLLTNIYHRFYIGDGYRTGRKIIPKDIGNDLTPLALAVWIMDDGSYEKGRIHISTYSFELLEICLLLNILQKQYGILMRSYRDRDKGYCIYSNQEQTKKLIQAICPYIIPSMRYKIGFRNPVTTGSL